jgi:predicted DNA-binding transcriptional regulator YafY
VTELEREVFEYVRDHGPISGRLVAAEIHCRKQAALRALRAMEARGVVLSTRRGFTVPPGGSQGVPARSEPQSSSAFTVILTRDEVEALLWAIEAVAHAYGRDHPDDGAGESAQRKLEEALAAEKERAA